MEFQPIGNAQFISDGTTADLKMPNGDILRATWRQRGRVTAWWPEKEPCDEYLGLYCPAEFKVIETRPEPSITVNGVQLSQEQAIAVRHAIQARRNDLCRTETITSLGKKQTVAYGASLAEVGKIIDLTH